MKFKVGDKVKVLQGNGVGKEGVVHELTSYGCAVDFGEELGFTHLCASYNNPLPTKTGWYYLEKNLQLIKEVTMETQMVYKALRVDDGVLKSVWAGIGCFASLIGITYTEGQISYAPKGQAGLSAFGELEDAIEFCGANNNHCYPMVVHEAVSLGRKGKALNFSDSIWKSSATYPAILLGKEVWSDKPKEPTELERLCEARTLLGGDIRTATRTSLNLFPKGRKYALYAEEDGSWTLYEGDRGRVLSTNVLKDVKVFIEGDKPKEEWVDVTKECSCSITLENRVAVAYEGTVRVLLGCNGAVISVASNTEEPRLDKDEDYKVEFLKTVGGWAATGGIKVLKKVVK